ncbi:hypothetical protein PAPHI01_1574 [Pancytospora philotis]|nr:hypothetical protein PAPHI01_1574 [Pancytospora philotis]
MEGGEFEQVTGAPLTPNSIPRSGRSPGGSKGSKTNTALRTITNPLDFAPRAGLFALLKIPAIIFFGMLIAYAVGRFGFNFLWMAPVAHVVYFVFRRRVESYTRTLETLHSEKDRRAALGEYETVEWLNYIVKKFWEVSEARVSSEIYSAVNRELKANTPKVLKSLKLTELTLGTRPPVVERIGFISRNDDAISIEFAVNFIPMQTSEDLLYYFGEEKKHWNTCIELTATVGFLSLPVLVRNFTFSGIFRAEIALTREIPFLESLSVCMLELPLVDFELHPLKAVDFMDLPYLSNTIRGIINSQVTKQLLYPQSIQIDLRKIAEYGGEVIGVVYVHVGRLETTTEAAVAVELSLNGKPFGQTAQRCGEFPIFNEGFYQIVRDTTQYIGVTMLQDSMRLHGKIHMRNLNKQHYAERVYLASEGAKRFLNVSSRFFRLVPGKTSSGIVALNIVSVSDLQALGDPRNRLYSTYCLVTLETKESVRTQKVVRTFETKRVFSTKDPFYNESFKFFVKHFHDYVVRINVVDDKTDETIGSVTLPITATEDAHLTKHRLSGSESGSIEVKFALECVDFADELEMIEAEAASAEIDNAETDNAETDNVETEGENASTVEVNSVDGDTEASETTTVLLKETVMEKKPAENGAVPGAFTAAKGKKKRKAKKHKKKKPAKPIADLNLGIYNKQAPASAFVQYKKVYKFDVVSISEQGAFYLVFETDHLNCKMEPFSTDLSITRSVLVPIKNEKTVRVRLFRMSVSGDIFVCEEAFNLDETVIVFDTVRVVLSAAVKPLISCLAPSDSEHVKFTQFRISEFSRSGEFSLITDTSFASVYNKLPGLNLAVSAAETPGCTLYDDTKEECQFALPVRNCAEAFSLTSSLSCRIECLSLASPFTLPAYSSKGTLEIYIIRATDVVASESGAPNPYVKVFLNNEKIFKTSKIARSTNPLYNESLKISVNKYTDTLGLHVCEHSAITTVNIICYRELSLLNITEGYGKHDIQMYDAESGKPVNTVLQVIFNYSPRVGASDSKTFKAWNS